MYFFSLILCLLFGAVVIYVFVLNRSRAFNLGRVRASREIVSYYLQDDDATSVEHMQGPCGNFLSLKRYHHSRCDSFESFIGNRRFSSEAGVENSSEEDDDLEDGFSELETSAGVDENPASSVAHESDNELISEHELSEEESDDDVAGDLNELEASDSETGVSKKRFSPTAETLQLLKAIMDAPGLSVNSVLEKWVEEGKDLNSSQIRMVVFNLRKRRMYGRALQVYKLFTLGIRFLLYGLHFDAYNIL